MKIKRLFMLWWLERKIAVHSYFLDYFSKAVEHNKREKKKLMLELYQVKYGP